MTCGTLYSTKPLIRSCWAVWWRRMWWMESGDVYPETFLTLRVLTKVLITVLIAVLEHHS